MAEAGKITAEFVAYERALGALERDPKLRNPDWLARELLSRKSRRALAFGLRHLARWRLERVVPGTYAYVQARTKYLDAAVQAALAEQPAQFVVLGAGLDSRCYRFVNQLRGVACFEVDHPATAAWKRQRLARWGGPHEHVTYVTIDFTRESLAQRLAECGFDASRPTLWLWEGVIYYLPEAAARETLGVIARTPAGSTLAFDYLRAGALATPERYYGAAENLRVVARNGEPMLFEIAPERLAEFLAEFGFTLRDHALPDEMARRHLVRSDGTPGPRPCAHFALATAVRA